jgi:putative monooxygenase
MNLLLVLASASLLGAEATPPPVVTADQAPTYEIAGGRGSAQLFFNAPNGSTKVALSVLRLGAGAAVPPHVHPESDELLYVETGTVEMIIGKQSQRATAGDAIFIPMGVEHSATVLVGPLVAVQLYAVPGPEQRFTQGKRLP